MTRRSILMPAVRGGHAYLVREWEPLDMRLVFEPRKAARWPLVVLAILAFLVGGVR